MVNEKRPQDTVFEGKKFGIIKYDGSPILFTLWSTERLWNPNYENQSVRLLPGWIYGCMILIKQEQFMK